MERLLRLFISRSLHLRQLKLLLFRIRATVATAAAAAADAVPACGLDDVTAAAAVAIWGLIAEAAEPEAADAAADTPAEAAIDELGFVLALLFPVVVETIW